MLRETFLAFPEFRSSCDCENSKVGILITNVKSLITSNYENLNVRVVVEWLARERLRGPQRRHAESNR